MLPAVDSPCCCRYYPIADISLCTDTPDSNITGFALCQGSNDDDVSSGLGDQESGDRCERELGKGVGRGSGLRVATPSQYAPVSPCPLSAMATSYFGSISCCHPPRPCPVPSTGHGAAGPDGQPDPRAAAAGAHDSGSAWGAGATAIRHACQRHALCPPATAQLPCGLNPGGRRRLLYLHLHNVFVPCPK